MRKILFLLLALLIALALAGCGDDDSSSDSDSKSGSAQSSDAGTDEGTSGGGTAGQTLELGVVKGKLKFDKVQLTAPAGEVTLKLTNADAVPHNIAVKDGDKELGAGELVTNGDVSEVTVTLEAGKTYKFYCQPHEAAGMTGELTVT